MLSADTTFLKFLPSSETEITNSYDLDSPLYHVTSTLHKGMDVPRSTWAYDPISLLDHLVTGFLSTVLDTWYVELWPLSETLSISSLLQFTLSANCALMFAGDPRATIATLDRTNRDIVKRDPNLFNVLLFKLKACLQFRIFGKSWDLIVRHGPKYFAHIYSKVI